MAPEAFASLCQTSEVIEQDSHGIKVLRLGNGNIFKVFRVKRLLSSAQVYNYARRFCDNAERLQALGVSTVAVKQLYHLSGVNRTAVEYQPLQGEILRQMAKENKLDPEIMKDLGEFIARLHDAGIYFRSLHQGNIVLTLEGNFGLIDIADMRFYSRPLPEYRRISNFRHFAHRSGDELTLLSRDLRGNLLDSYAGASKASPSCRHKISCELGLTGH